jgi:hypothetical protein
LKQNEKIGSETKNFRKQNKAKIGSINFALVGSKKIKEKKAKRSEKKKNKISLECAKRISFHIVFLLRENIFLAKPVHPT